MNTDSLEVKALCKDFEYAGAVVKVLDKVKLVAKSGETVAIIGPSGAGKSTFLNIIGLLEEPDSGIVSMGEQELQALSRKQRETFRGQNIGFVFQNHHLLPQLTTKENVLLPSLINKNNEQDVDEILEFVGLKERKDFYPWQMSGGECQRVAIARGVMTASKLLLCDEPTGNLDEENGEKIIALLKRIANERKVTIVMVTHNVDYAKKFDSCYVLQKGRLVEYKES